MPQEVAPGSLIRARDVHSIVGLAACGIDIGIGLVPDCAAELRADTFGCRVVPAVSTPRPGRVLLRTNRSPVLNAFLDIACEQMT